ncbi:MAG TPA: helix-turn-helix domain-containing protein [Clostridiales bacterium]|nr:helix-turn-helix domain-containing protein [Clostridiales bacterium]
MRRRQAEHAMKLMLMSGYGHYSRAEEHKIIMNFLQGNLPQLDGKGVGDIQFAKKAVTKFSLAEQPLRAMKNSLICFVAVICRYAADLGADDERCYALSDYYINEIESCADMNNWLLMLEEISRHYIELVRVGREERYSLPIYRAIRYINQHLYEECRLQDIAEEVKLHPNYLSAQFKTETGISITQYIRNKKIDEAKNLLRNEEYSVTEIAEMLGYNSLSYFSKVFNQVNGCSPREYNVGVFGN